MGLVSNVSQSQSQTVKYLVPMPRAMGAVMESSCDSQGNKQHRVHLPLVNKKLLHFQCGLIHLNEVA